MEGSASSVKKMAELLKSGATMLAETCPVEGCALPLFKLRSGETVCPVHGRVHIVKTDEEAMKVREEITLKAVLERLEGEVLRNIARKLDREYELAASELIEYLEVLERIYRIKSMIKPSSASS